jgi:hypothetical protein
VYKGEKFLLSFDHQRQAILFTQVTLVMATQLSKMLSISNMPHTLDSVQYNIGITEILCYICMSLFHSHMDKHTVTPRVRYYVMGNRRETSCYSRHSLPTKSMEGNKVWQLNVLIQYLMLRSLFFTINLQHK